MSLEDAQTFLLVVDTGSFTAAAQRLTLPISSVSRRVARLERRLGIQMLLRSTRSLHLTPAGELYAREMRDLIARMGRLENQLSGLASQPTGLLRITVPSRFTSETSDLFPGFLATYPKISVQVFEEDRLVDLVGEGMDAALRGSATAEPGVVSSCLLTSRFGLFSSPAYLAERPPIKDLADLAEGSCILGGHAGSEAWTLSCGGEARTVKVSGRFSSRNLNACRNAAVWGLGVALLPQVACQTQLDCGELVQVLPDCSGADASLWLLYPEARYPTPALQAFVSHVQQHPWSFGGQDRSTPLT